MKRIIYSLLFAAGALFAGCSDDDTQAPLNTPIQEGNNLYGVVTDPNGAPVGGIVVSDGFSCVGPMPTASTRCRAMPTPSILLPHPRRP